jgi:hypothetical protein
MARIALIVLLLVVAIVSSSAQSGSIKAVARGGYKTIGTEGEATGSISGEIRLGAGAMAEIMFVLKDVGGATNDGQNEAIIHLKGIERSKMSGNKLVVTGMGFFQGEQRDVEITLVDSKKSNVSDEIRVRVLRAGRVEFDRSAKVPSNSISITRQ